LQTRRRWPSTAGSGPSEQTDALRLELSGGKHNNTAQKLHETNGWLRDNEYYHYSLPVEHKI
jgi:hypothetical protein